VRTENLLYDANFATAASGYWDKTSVLYVSGILHATSCFTIIFSISVDTVRLMGIALVSGQSYKWNIFSVLYIGIVLLSG
jgi:hypothetical protein